MGPKYQGRPSEVLFLLADGSVLDFNEFLAWIKARGAKELLVHVGFSRARLKKWHRSYEFHKTQDAA